MARKSSAGDEPPVTVFGLAFYWLRRRLGLSRPKLEERLKGRVNLPAELQWKYEKGTKNLDRERLEEVFLPLGYDPVAIDALVFADRLINPGPFDQPPSPVALTQEEIRRIDRTVLAAGWSVAEMLRAELVRQRKQDKIQAAREQARTLCQELLAAEPAERRKLVTTYPELRTWAVAERLCDLSVRAAAHRVDEALERAQLALFIAERIPGDKAFSDRLRGYCWRFVGNALRVGNEFDAADEAFARAEVLWKAGADSDGLLSEWRGLDLEASLRREQHRFSEALDLLARALAAAGADAFARGRILMKKSHVLERTADFAEALAALAEATPAIDAAGDPQLLLGLVFNTAANLAHLERWAEVATLLPRVRELAEQQRNELALVRVLWLEAKGLAGQGHKEEAMHRLEQVQCTFAAHTLPYDAALSGLDLAVLWLEAGRTGKVKTLAVAMGWIFQAKGISREAIAALGLFCEAARQETATAELARQAMRDIEKVRRSAPRSEAAARGRR